MSTMTPAVLVTRYETGWRHFVHIDVAESQLANANFVEANFSRANFSQCELSGVRFERCDFDRARLNDTVLRSVTFSTCRLSRTSFNAALMHDVTFLDCDLVATDFARAEVNDSTFAKCRVDGAVADAAKFLASDITAFADGRRIHFAQGAFVDWSTICKSLKAPTLASFLRHAGMPEVFAEYSISCARALDPDSLFKLMRSTFISYGGPDTGFAQQLSDDLHRNGVSTFFFSRDAVPGKKLHHTMRDGIKKYDRIIVVCSAASLSRAGVRFEIDEALTREARDGGATYIVPVTLDDFIFDASDNLAEILRERVVADFRETAAYDRAFRQLLTALRRDSLNGGA
jgi:hypothetical protein